MSSLLELFSSCLARGGASLLVLQAVAGAQAECGGIAAAAIDDSEVEAIEPMPIVLVGRVAGPDGSPVERAAITTSAGGQAISDAHGRFRLELRVPLDAESVQVTAVGRGGS